MSARLLGALDRLPPWARRSLMIAVPLVLLAVLVAGFALAPRGAGDHSERASAAGRLLPPSPTTATEAHTRPALPAAKTSQSSAAAPAGRSPRRRRRPGAAHPPPVRGPVSEQPPPPSPGSAEAVMLAVARRFAVAYMPYQVGRLPRWARTAIERTCTPAFAHYLLAQPAQFDAAAGGAPEGHRDLPGRKRRAGRESGRGGGQLRLSAGQRRHRRVPAEAGQRARALAGRSPGGVSGGAQAVPARAGADDPAAAAGGDAGVPCRGRGIGGAMRRLVCRRQRARRRRSAGGRPDLRGGGRAVRARRPWPFDLGGDQLYVESTFGQSNDAGVHSGANYAGAMGPMQFLQGTWDTYKVQAPGGAVPPNVYDEADAVYSATNYLKDSGAPGDWPGAIFAYNHSSAYVQQVLSQAAGYYTQGLTAQGSAASTPTSSSGAATTGGAFSVPAATGDPAGPITLAPGQPTIVAATYFTDQTGAWGDNLLVSHDSCAELSPGIPGSQVTRQNATMLGGLPYMTPLRITNPQNGRSVILYKRDIGARQPLSNTLDGYHYRIDLTAWADQQLGLPGSGLVQVTRLTGPVSTPGGGQACSGSSGFTPAGSGLDPIPGFTIGRDDMGVDASAPVGTPIYAPLDSQLVEVVGNWYAGQPGGAGPRRPGARRRGAALGARAAADPVRALAVRARRSRSPDRRAGTDRARTGAGVRADRRLPTAARPITTPRSPRRAPRDHRGRRARHSTGLETSRHRLSLRAARRQRKPAGVVADPGGSRCERARWSRWPVGSSATRGSARPRSRCSLIAAAALQRAQVSLQAIQGFLAR